MNKFKKTNNGKDGGTLLGKAHYDKDGNSLGGIKTIITDDNRPVEVEGGEVIINKHAAKKHWKELSRINQSAGNGVPIVEPKFKKGGNAEKSKFKSKVEERKKKVGKVMREFKEGKLKSHGRKIKDRKQAIAIALSEARRLKNGGDIKDADIEKRWDKKKSAIAELSNNIQSLRYNLTKDLKSDNEKKFLTALVISIIDSTGERVGNENSAENGHFGVTGFKKKHIKIDGNTITLKYIGKSGVEHYTKFTDENIANALKKAIQNSKSKFVFNTSDEFQIKADGVNRYLSDFNVTAKDLRGYSANKWVIEKLKEITPEEDETKRKSQFNKILSSVAEKIGHGRVTLKTHYLIPEIQSNFIENGKITNIKEIGGIMKSGGVVTYKQKFNKKYGYDKNESHELKDIAKETGVSKKGLQEIYNKGVGAYKTNPSSVRPNVKSKEQWAMGRIYSAVMGGKAARVDAKELKMKTGGKLEEQIYIEFLNKDKGFKKDTKYFKSYEEAVKWAKQNFDKFNPDMIKFKMAKGGELEKGVKAEQEHIGTAKKLYKHEITPKQAAKSIAKEHLKEDSKYYTKLSKAKLEKGGDFSIIEKMRNTDTKNWSSEMWGFAKKIISKK